MATTLREPETHPASLLGEERKGVSSTRRWWKNLKLVIPLTVTVVGLIAVAAVGIAMTRGNGDNVSVSPSAAAATPAAALASPAGGPVTAPVAPVAAPVAPIAAAPSAPSANVTSPVATQGLTSGKFPSSQIKTSSTNLVLAFFAAGLQGDRQTWSLYIPASPEADVLFADLKKIGNYGFVDKNSWLQVGGVINIAMERDPLKVIRPSDAPEGRYAGAALLALPEGDAVYWFVTGFLLEKAPSGDWGVTKLFAPGEDSRMWDRGAFERELERIKSRPGNVFSLK